MLAYRLIQNHPASNSDGRTVRVHFIVTDLVEPYPCKRILSIWHAFGYYELEGIGTFSVAKIPRSIGWTAANDIVDHLPLADLTRSATVDSNVPRKLSF